MSRKTAQRMLAIHDAFRAGDLEALKSAVEDPSVIPNGAMPLAIGPCLEYAIYHSPLPFVRELLEIGADPNPTDHYGYPPLIAALMNARRRGDATASEVVDVLELLISHGADPNQRGINDYTPLHVAVQENNAEAIDLLLRAGADPTLRTRIDSCETAQELAEEMGLTEIAEALERAS